MNAMVDLVIIPAPKDGDPYGLSSMQVPGRPCDYPRAEGRGPIRTIVDAGTYGRPCHYPRAEGRGPVRTIMDAGTYGRPCDYPRAEGRGPVRTIVDAGTWSTL